MENKSLFYKVFAFIVHYVYVLKVTIFGRMFCFIIKTTDYGRLMRPFFIKITNFLA